MGEGFSGDRRGVSDVLGYVLIVGMVTTGMMLVLLTGASALDQLQDSSDRSVNAMTLGEFDQRLNTIVSDRHERASFNLGRIRPGDVSVRDNASSGHVRILVNGGTCSATVPLSSIRYEDNRGRIQAYQAGGMWRKSPGSESSVMVSPPDFQATNGTIRLSVVNASGSIPGKEVRLRELPNQSTTRSAEIEEQLFNGSQACRRPDNVTVKVHSDFYVAWGKYVERETGVGVDTYDTNDTARVFLSQSWLPEVTNDSRNRVVDLSDPEIATVDRSDDTITVDKEAGNDYVAFAEPLGNGTQVSEVRVVEGEVAYRPALDVAFVMDESGSMADYADGTRKTEAAKEAAKSFVGQLNETKDRAGLVGYTWSARYLLTGEEYFSNDFSGSGVNQSIEGYNANGGTSSDTGLRKANTMFAMKSPGYKKKVAILLSDGKNSDSDDDDRLYAQAREARKNGVTVYTVGFGDESDIDEDVLQKTANLTGGEYYYADDANELDAVFESIFAKISDTKVIFHDPVTATASVGGRTYKPQLGDKYDDVATMDGGYNVNDPRVSQQFSFTMNPVNDGNVTNITAVSYNCTDYAFTNQFVKNESDGQTYRRVRCVDVDTSSKTLVEPSNTTIYIDGDDASALLSNESAWWQDDLRNDTLRGYLDGDEFDLKSNQAVVVYRFESSGEPFNRLVMLYEIGLDDQTGATSVVDVRVTDVKLSGD